MKKLLLIAITTTMLMMSACTSNQTTEEANTSDENIAEDTNSAESTDNYYPITVLTYDYAGEEVEMIFEEAPTSVVAGYQGSIETMIALGLEEHVSSSFGLDNEVKPEWQEGFTKVNYLEDMRFPDKETMTMLEPDLILSWGSIFAEDRLGDVDNWTAQGVNTYINTNTRAGGHARTIENEMTDILNIGKIFNANEEAEALVAEMQDGIDKALLNVPQEGGAKIAILEPRTDSVTNYNAETLGGDIAIKLGAQLAITEKAIGKEDIILANPEIIFVVYMPYDGENPDEVIAKQMSYFTEDPAFASIDAVVNKNLVPLMLGDMYASGPRTLDGIHTIAKGLYPELELE